MVELLTTIVILGILMTVSIVAVNKVLENARNKYYVSLKKNITLAAESYIQDNRSKLPKEIGEKTTIQLKTLQDNNYIKEVTTYNKKVCKPGKDKAGNDLETYVEVFKYSKTKYSYLTYLYCKPDYPTKDTLTAEDNEETKPEIKINFSNPDNTEVKTAKATITIEGKDDFEILGYSYVVYKNGKEVINSGSLEGKLKTEVKVNIKINKYTPGEIKVKVSAINIYGQKATSDNEQNYSDIQGPECIIKDADKADNEKEWISKKDPETSRKITVGCDDGDGVGCEKAEYTKTFTKDAKTGKIEISDLAGNKTDCKVSVYIDKTAPTQPKVNMYKWKNNSTTPSTESGLSSYTNNTWSNKNILTKASGSTDNLSGIDHYEYTTTGATENNTNKKGAQRNIKAEGTSTIKYRACDEANNCSTYTSAKTIKIDKTKPNCEITKSGTIGENGWYKEKDVTLSLTKDDNEGGSGTERYGLTKSSTATYNSRTSATQGNTSGITWYGYVKDKAGNKETCNTGSFKVDKTKPTCGITKSGTIGENGWYKEKDVTLSLTKSDNKGGSDIDGYGLTKSSTATYNSSTGATQGNTSGITWYGYVKDKAGNKGTCNTGSFKVDKTAPGVPTSTIRVNDKNGAVRSNSSNWTNETRWWGNFNATETTSGINHYEYSSGCTGSKSGNLSSEYIYNTSRKWSFCIRAVDNAGNIGNWSSTYYFNIDKTVPTCSTAKSNTGTTTGVTATFTCSNDNLSPLTCTSKKTNLTSSQSYTIKDGAGNTGKCSVDVTAVTQYRKKECNTCKRCDSADCDTYKECKTSGCGSYSYNCNAYSCKCSKKCSEWGCYGSSGLLYATTYKNGCSSGHTLKCKTYTTTCKTCYNTCWTYYSCRNSACGCEQRKRNCSKCGCKNWNSWTKWGTKKYTCNSNSCQSESRTVYE